MHTHRIVSIVIGLMLVLVSGCDRKPSVAINTPASTGATGAVSNENLIVRFHWLGKSRLAGETNAARFMSLWNMPESTALENQTLNKLALAPWRLTRGDAATNGAPTAQMRGLLDDLVQAEWYLEVVRDVANQPGQVALAVRMDPERAALWKTNLASVVESLCGSKITAETDGWSLHYKTPDSGLLQFVRAGDWTLVGLAHGQNALLGEFRARIGRDHAPYAARTTNYWLDANVDLVQLNDALALGWKLPASIPRIKLTEIGDGENVRTRGELVFPKPLPITLDPWSIPTNLIHEPLVSFAAVRGVGGMISNYVSSWFGGVPVPNQFFSWGRSGPPLQMYVAAATDDAKTIYPRLEDQITTSVAPYISPQKFGAITRSPGANRMVWDGLFFGVPGISVVTNQAREFLLLSFAPFFVSKSTNQIPPPLAHRVCEPEDLVFFNWEQTGERLAHWRYFDDASRMIFDAAHHPRFNSFSLGIDWIAMGITNLEYSVTEARLKGQNQIAFTRKATVGLTALELDVLANWLELANFPGGFASIFATNPSPAVVRRKVGAQPPTPNR